MADYRFLLVNVITGEVLGELPISKASYSFVLNGPGAFKGTMPLSNTSNGVELWTSAELDPARRAIYVERDGVLIWGGMLWTMDADVGSETLNLNAEGFLSYFRRRVLTSNAFYFGTDQALIVKSLIDWAQNRPGGDIRVDTSGITSHGVTRYRGWWGYERKVIGELVEDLAAVQGGFDFYFSHAWSGGEPVSSLNLTYPSEGRKTDHVFELGANVDLLGLSMDGTDQATRVDVTGSGDGTKMLVRTATDPSLRGTYPQLDAVYSFTDVTRTSTLQAKADYYLARSRLPIALPKIRASSGTIPGLGSYIVGDQVRVRGEHGWLQLDGTYRITSFDVSVDSSGTESIPITLAPLEAFDDAP